MILNTTNILQFELTDVFLLLFGVGFGILITMMVYVLIALYTIKPQKYIVKSSSKGLTDDEIDEKIKFAQDIFLDKELQGELSDAAHCKEVCTSLVHDIAKVYFPESKRPLFELSVDEVLMLSIYISNRINEILDHKGVRLFKKIKISTLVGMGDAKKNIDDSSLMKVTKKYKLKEAFTTVTGALNVVNPIYWAKKLVVNTTLSYALNKIFLMIIAITAEETYKIYSKNVFNKEVNYDSKYSDLANEIESDLADVTLEEIDSLEEENYG